MNYIIFDLEYNQADRENRRLSKTMNKRMPRNLKFEILQIGAVKVDENLKYISNFKMYVKPNFLPKINSHVLQILNVEEKYIELNSLNFNKVFREFRNFIGDGENTLVTWSNSDIQVLQSNLNAWNIKFHVNKLKHIDLQRVISNKDNLKSVPSLMKTAIKYNINVDNISFHDAYADASVTKQILQRIGLDIVKKYNHNINFIFPRKIKIYDNDILMNEIGKIPHCNNCGKFISTLSKTKIYSMKDKNNLLMKKLCYCDRCEMYFFKNYRYEIDNNKLLIKDRITHRNNIQCFSEEKEELDFLIETENNQMLNYLGKK